MTLKEWYEEKRKEILDDAEAIESASDYTHSYLLHGKGCDSSTRASKRMEWVLAAEDELLKENKKRILSRAAQMCRDSLGEEI